MSAHENRRMERLLADGTPADESALGALLAAAAGPARDGELAGEHAAVAAFRAARLHPVDQPRRPLMIKTTLAGLLTAKVLIPTAAAAAVGGIAVAAATGTLPVPGQGPAAPPVEVTTSRVPDAKPSERPDQLSPSLHGLCQAYVSGSKEERGKATESPAFQVLITEAGGADNVAAYCADGLAKRPGKSADPTKPTTPAHPTGKPTSRPTGAPDGVPAATTPAHPTGAPATSRPTGQPARPTTPAHPTGAP